MQRHTTDPLDISACIRFLELVCLPTGHGHPTRAHRDGAKLAGSGDADLAAAGPGQYSRKDDKPPTDLGCVMTGQITRLYWTALVLLNSSIIAWMAFGPIFRILTCVCMAQVAT